MQMTTAFAPTAADLDDLWLDLGGAILTFGSRDDAEDDGFEEDEVPDEDEDDIEEDEDEDDDEQDDEDDGDAQDDDAA